eukprot:6210057-Pleurochrysis_carterae.AAC.1
MTAIPGVGIARLDAPRGNVDPKAVKGSAFGVTPELRFERTYGANPTGRDPGTAKTVLDNLSYS